MENLFRAVMQLSNVFKIKLSSKTLKGVRSFAIKKACLSMDSAIRSKAIEAIRSSTNKKHKTFYLLDSAVAKQFADLIMAKPAKNVSYIAEVNSGLGLLTEELLKAGIPTIHVFENIDYFLSNLKNIESKYPGRVFRQNINFQETWSVGYLDFRDNTNKMQQFFGAIEQRTWEDDAPVQIIAALADVSFICRLMSTLVFHTTLAKYGRMVLHAAIPPSEWTLLTCTNKTYDLYRSRSILFQIIFDYEVLGTLPRTAFHPKYKRIRRRKRNRGIRAEIRRNDSKFLNVVRIEPKRDLFTKGFTQNDMIPFNYFVSHHLKSRNTRVIPALESWIPGCGRALISMGYSIYTKFGELSPVELLNLYKTFRSWPGYKRSTFASCMNSVFLKLDENIALDTNADQDCEVFQLSPAPENSSVDHQSREVTTTKKL